MRPPPTEEGRIINEYYYYRQCWQTVVREVVLRIRPRKAATPSHHLTQQTAMHCSHPHRPWLARWKSTGGYISLLNAKSHARNIQSQTRTLEIVLDWNNHAAITDSQSRCNRWLIVWSIQMTIFTSVKKVMFSSASVSQSVSKSVCQSVCLLSKPNQPIFQKKN